VKFSKTLIYSFTGVNFEPYRAKFENLIGRKVDSIELFPASEGFFCLPGFSKEKVCCFYLRLEFFMNLLRVTSFILINQDVIPLGSRVGSQLRFDNFN
jgi:hypothetical protein